MLSIGRKLLLYVMLRATLVHSIPSLSFPINSQVPPVARIGEPFSFVFSDRTFTSDDGSSLSYSLVDPPSWLSLDSSSRKLTGTPQSKDVGPGDVLGVDISLEATDGTGSVSDHVTLVVSRGQAPSVQKPISDQIPTFGEYSEPSSILYFPEESFEFTFASDTFADPDATELDYYSVLINNSPLPAWLSFDAETLAYTGLTPPFDSLIEPPQTFSVKLIASDVAGFSATSVNFSIVVGSHALTTDQPSIKLNATAGEPLVYNGLLGSIKANGLPADPSQVNVTTESLPSWLTLDQSSWKISGTPPDTAESTIFTVVMEDEYADVLNITISVQVPNTGSLFQSTFPALTVKPGESFSFDLSPYLLDPSSADVTTTVQPATSWISWDAASLTLKGDTPSKAPQSSVDVTFTVTPKSRKTHKRAYGTQSQDLVIQIDADAATTPSPATYSSTSSPTSSTSSAATSTAAATADSTSTPPTKWTIIAIVISVVALIIIACCICIWCCGRKSKRSRKYNSNSTLSSINAADAFPDETYVHTPGRPGHVPDLQRTTTTSPPHDNEKPKKPSAVWKASGLRRELTSSPAPAGFSLGAIYNTSTNDLPPSMGSTPRRMPKIKDMFTSIRSLRVVNALPLNRRTSTGSSLQEDEGRSPNVHQATGFGFDLESAVGGPPVLKLSQGSKTSLRDALEGSLYPATQGSSLQITPEPAYKAEQQQQQQYQLRKQQEKQWRMSRQTSQRQPKRNSVQQRVATPGVLRCRNPDEGEDSVDPFTDIHVPGATVSPIFPDSQFNNPNGPFNNSTKDPISPTTPMSSPDRPSLPIPSSSVLASKVTRPLRPAHSQKSIVSPSPSLSAQSRKIGRKVSASAKGAIYALQSPQRRTYAAFRKHSSNSISGNSNNADEKNNNGNKQQQQRVRSARRRQQRGPVLEDDESTAANTPNLGSDGGDGARSMSSPTTGHDHSRSSYYSNSGGVNGSIAGYLSPRVWPQPALSTSTHTTQRSVTVPLSKAEQEQQEQEQQQTIIRRRPVPSMSTAAWTGASISSASDIATADMLPSSLHTPVRTTGGTLVSSPHGLGILNPYADIASSSPYVEEERNWEKVEGASDDDEEHSPTGWRRRQQQQQQQQQQRAGSGSGSGSGAAAVVGQPVSGAEDGRGEAGDVRVSVAGLSVGSKASSGGVAYL